ncbi:MAG: hypothetical protein WA771_08460 [Chthoniobacterales bacterium]
MAAPIVVNRSLSELGFVRAERLTGKAVERDFFFPLPSRNPAINGSDFVLNIESSPFLSADSVVTVLVNERPVVSAAVGAGKSLEIRAPVPADALLDDPTSQVLKLTVRARLELTGSGVPIGEIQRAKAWVDVQPSTVLRSVVESDDLDWLAVGRLPVTLGPEVAVQLPGGGGFADELALRAASWAAYVQPFGRVTATRSGSGVGDQIVIESADEGEAGIRVSASEGGRVITMSAGSQEEADKVWALLRDLGDVPIPSDRVAVVRAGEQESKNALTVIRAADPAITELVRGPGDTERLFRFVPWKLGPRARDLELHVAGRISDLSGAGQIVGAAFLNGRLVHSERLDPATERFVWSVPLPVGDQEGESEVRIAMFPSESAAQYFWQLEETTGIRVNEADAGDAVTPLSLLEAAQSAFASAPYEVLASDGEKLEVAASVVIWLQRVNRSTILDPKLVAASSGEEAAVVVGSLPKSLIGIKETLPIAEAEGRLVFRNADRGGALLIASDTSVGIWQLGFNLHENPVIVAAGVGLKGPTVLREVSTEIAAARWIEAGDVLIGDGRSPVLTMTTRERKLPTQAETFAVAKGLELTKAGAAGTQSHWGRWRWWLIGVLWLAVSLTVLFVYKQGRQHAR